MNINVNPQTAEEMFELAMAFEKGEVIEHDLVRANFWYLKACEAGDARAYCHVGRFYETQADMDAAIMYYAVGAEAGMKDCMLRLYRIYRDGIGEVPADSDKAAKYLAMSGEGGD